MTDLVELLSLEDRKARHIWLNQNAAERDEALIAELWLEAERREQTSPETVTVVARLARDMANIWQELELEAIALRIEASMQRVLGDHERAQHRYQRAIKLYDELGLPLEAARTTVGLIDTMMYRGQYAHAANIADWAISEMRHTNDLAVLSRLLTNRGNLFARLADFPAAQASYTEAREIFTALDQPQRVAMVEANEANVLTNLNQFRAAEVRYHHARDYFSQTGLTGAVAQIDHNLGYLAFAQGDYQHALQHFATARTYFMAQQSKIDMAYVDLYRAETYLALNLWRDALQTARATQPLFIEAAMQWEEGVALLIMAAAFRQLGYEQTVDELLARAEQNFAMENNRFWLAVTMVNQAVSAWQREECDQARMLLRRSLQTFIKADVPSRAAQCAVILGEVELTAKDLPAAKASFQQALDLLGETLLPSITYGGHYGLAKIYQLRGEIAAAIGEYNQALTEIELAHATIGAEDYKMAFRQDKVPIYEALILLYLQQGTLDTIRSAFDLVERAKARGLLDTMARIDEEQTGGIPAELLARYAALKQELNWYYHRLHTPSQMDDQAGREPSDKQRVKTQQREWQGMIQHHEANLREFWRQWRHPDLVNAPQNPIWTISSAEIQQTLPSQALLLEFFVIDEHLWVFGITSEHVWSRQLSVTRTTLLRLLDQLRFQFNKFSYGGHYRQHHHAALLASTNDCLYKLYMALLAPLPEIHAVEQLIMVPHGLLHAVPFHALCHNAHYLIESHAVSYAPSATILARVMTHQHLVPTDPPLIVGVADPAIPHVEAEVNQLQQLFPTAQLHFGEQATTAKLLTEPRRPPFLHISTHAMFRQDNPTFSSLKLADGWLTVNDIYHLATAAPLVTLSACETGRTEVIPGDELMGLCRGFFGIGAQSLVLSLWRVEDRSTADLMVDFYAGLRSGQSVQTALRSAQLKLLATHPHPYYWAPFLLTGNPDLRIAL